jgi:hypothetical protein
MRWLAVCSIISLLVTHFSGEANAAFPEHTLSSENEYPAAFYRQAGLIENPAQDEDVQYLISEGLLDPLWPDKRYPEITPTASVGAATGGLSHFKLKQDVHYEGLVVLTLVTVYVVQTTQEQANKTNQAIKSITSVATKIVVGGGGAIFGCGAPYLLDPLTIKTKPKSATARRWYEMSPGRSPSQKA